MNDGYKFRAECGLCDGILEHVTSGRVIAGRETSSVARCPKCGVEWLVRVHLVAVSARPPVRTVSPASVAQCGTSSGWRKHVREKTEPCEPCRTAHRETVASYKRKSRSKVLVDA